MSVFFLGSWEMNRSAEQTNRLNREAVLVRFICSALRFISDEPRKKDRSSRDLYGCNSHSIAQELLLFDRFFRMKSSMSTLNDLIPEI